MTPAKPLILVADDEPYILRLVIYKLSHCGFEVVGARNGLLAWQCLARQPIGLMITDYQMPGLTGLELARRMYQDQQLARVPIILLTAKSFQLTPEDILETNIVAQISKPFSPRELLEVGESHVVQTGEASHP